MEEILKLQRLKLPNASGTASNENVFREISKQTGTLIFWEAGCKSPPMRKEPCIKITGPEENVRKAKEMLLDRMEIQSNRVVMKIDVTHLEHPSLIGKGGKLIQKVMDSTGCHIHFPDGNLKCPTPASKSNYVSIYGDPMSVERARVMIRALIPIQLFFEVPSSSCFAPILESFPPESKFLASPYGLMVYSAPSPTGPIVIVRCNQDQFPNLRKEIVTLMEFICCTNGANLPPVHILTEIVHSNIPFVKGPDNCNVEATMKKTGAEISFPLIDKKISVKITGNLDCVYMAWQEVMNLLPVNVSFDVNETREVKGEYIDSLKDCGITVFTRPKAKYFVKNVTLKGPEKFSKQMLQFRQRLLRLPILAFNPDIQDINLASNFQASLIDQNSPHVIPSPVSGMVSKNLLTEISQLTDYYMQPNPLATVPSRHDQNCIETLMANKTTLNENDVGLAAAKAAESMKLEDYFLSDDWFKNIPSNSMNQALADLNLSPSSLSSDQSMESKASADSCNLFIAEGNSESLAEDYYRKKVQAARAMRRPIKSIESAQVPSSMWAGYGFSQSMPASVIKEAANQYYFNYNNDGSSPSSSEDSDSWENVVLKDCLDANVWSNNKETTFSHSNYFDFLRNMPVPFDYVTKDILPELLWQHGLHKYIDIFTKEEIDYQTFLVLTDHDLKTLGIAHHARMKIVCLIKELQDSRTNFKSKKFDAAPGAERKSESSF